jgi:RNA polymerase sigma-70 factor (ECF subfamily)
VPPAHLDIPTYPDEAQLIEGLRRHEPDACAGLVQRFGSLLYAQAMRLLGDPDEAEGALQTALIAACAKLDAYEGRGGLGTWLYRIVTNESLMLLRSRRPHVALDEIAEFLGPDDVPQRRQPWPKTPLDAALEHELREQLLAALAQLPAGLRAVFVLRKVDGLSTEETAVALGIGESAVKVRLHRARLRLRELLAGYLAEGV